MNNVLVRIKNIEISNFKNTKHGYVDLENKKSQFRSSVLALYGQNGSGKTSLINAIELLKNIFTGQKIDNSFLDDINVDSESLELKFTFEVKDIEKKKLYNIFYEVNLTKQEEETTENVINGGSIKTTIKPLICNEKLSYSYSDQEGNKKKKTILADTSSDKDILLPKNTLLQIIGKKDQLKDKLALIKELTKNASKSYIFSLEFFKVIEASCSNSELFFAIKSLIKYAYYDLFIITTSASARISLDDLPIIFKNVDSSFGTIVINLTQPSVIPENVCSLLEKVISNMNIVLRKIVPKLEIGINYLGSEINEKGSVCKRIQIVSKKNSKEIPLKNESEGIKKIISILHLLISVYNNPSVTVAIDEIDSGIFEYLLGELLKIISERGKGQLIFTLHNLRPLETLDASFVAFTTVNPNNRYIRYSNIKRNNNLRHLYYRDIIVGLSKEPIYESADNAEVAIAFRKAGLYDES